MHSSVEVLTAQGKSVADAIRSIGVTEVTYYRWRNEYGGLKGDQVKRLKELEAENARLRRAVSDLTLDKMILAEAAKGSAQAAAQHNFLAICLSSKWAQNAYLREDHFRGAGQFTYFHVELADHALILAEGVPAETFVDNVTRRRFDNHADYAALYGEAAATIAEMDAPRIKSARQLPAARPSAPVD